MPELGDYAGAVLGAYAASGLLIGLLVAHSVLRAGRVRRALRRAEAKQGRSHV
ncbi:heme exporter protein CcmD [Halovulum marinum]|nr:heme exporter protein CcmD [Halovulum marinum]